VAWLGAVLIVLWLLGWLAFKVTSGIIHLVLIVGVAMVIWSLVKRGSRAVQRP
jgi:hypothetical protein